MSDRFNFSWGRPIPEDILPNIVATWGARAIYNNQVIDFLPDRQSMTTPHIEDQEMSSRARNELAKWINTKGLSFLRRESSRLYTDSSRVVTLDEGKYHIEAPALSPPMATCTSGHG